MTVHRTKKKRFTTGSAERKRGEMGRLGDTLLLLLPRLLLPRNRPHSRGGDTAWVGQNILKVRVLLQVFLSLLSLSQDLTACSFIPKCVCAAGCVPHRLALPCLCVYGVCECMSTLHTPPHSYPHPPCCCCCCLPICQRRRRSTSCTCQPTTSLSILLLLFHTLEQQQQQEGLQKHPTAVWTQEAGSY